MTCTIGRSIELPLVSSASGLDASVFKPGTLRIRNQQKGAVIPILGITIFVCLLMVGLAIDAGNLYLCRVMFQKAVDAAAIAGAKHLAITSWQQQSDPGTSQGIKNLIRDQVRETIYQNIEMRRATDTLVIHDQTTGVVIDIDKSRVRVMASWDIPLLFLRAFPGFGSRYLIEARATARW